MSTDSPSATAAPLSTSSYPVAYHTDYPASTSRLFAVPVVGILIRFVLLIPHIIIAYVLGIVVAVIQLIAWIPVLFGGRYHAGLYGFVSGVMRWWANILSYLYGLTDKYPPFSLDQQADYPVHVTFERPAHSVPGWAIPVVGYYAKAIALIPHFICIAVVGVIVLLVHLVAWIPALMSRTYPTWAFSITSGYIRWSLRMFSWFLGLTDKYPPFKMSA
jgi:hypothetical protein